MKKAIMAIFMALLVSSCGEPRIDGSSGNTFIKSIDDVRKTLPVEKQAQFDDAVEILSYRSIEEVVDTQNFDKDLETYKANIAKALNGKTADQIISEAEPYREILVRIKSRTGPCSQ